MFSQLEHYTGIQGSTTLLYMQGMCDANSHWCFIFSRLLDLGKCQGHRPVWQDKALALLNSYVQRIPLQTIRLLLIFFFT